MITSDSQPTKRDGLRFQVRQLQRRVREFLRHPFSTYLPESRALYDDLLRHATQTQSLDDLLDQFPRRICAALSLATFYLFIFEHTSDGKTEYRLLDRHASPMAFPASSAVVARMRRERKPSLFVSPATGAGQDPWQLLATPSELHLLESLNTQLLFPLEGRTNLIGFVSLSRPAQRAFSPAELRFLRDLGPRMGRGLETALLLQTLSRQAVASDRATRELDLAREVQGHLLPRTLPEVPALDLAAFYQTAEQIGGDYYDSFLTATGSLCTVVADVSGKGIPAALLMAALRASLHGLMLQPGLSLPHVVMRLNDLLYQASTSSRYATLFLCLYDPTSHMLEYVNAGHNPPLLLRADCSILRLTTGGTVIGLLADCTFRSETIPLHPGDTLIAYTDGITEAINPAGAEWSEAGLQAALLPSDDGSSPSPARGHLLRHLRKVLAEFTAGTDPVDDMTLFVLSYGTQIPPSDNPSS